MVSFLLGTFNADLDAQDQASSCTNVSLWMHLKVGFLLKAFLLRQHNYVLTYLGVKG